MGFIKDEAPWCGGRISQRVLCLRANNPSPMTYVGTNTYIVAEPGAKQCVVVDPAPAGEQVQRTLRACEEAGLAVGAIVATHDHPDHIEGIPQLASATGAPVFAPRLSAIKKMLKEGTAKVPADCEEACAASLSTETAASCVGEGKPVQADSLKFRNGQATLAGQSAYPSAASCSEHSIEDRPLLNGSGEQDRISKAAHSKGACPQLNELSVGPFAPFEGGPQFEVIALPGHSEDSVGLLLSSEETLFTGDVLFRHGPTVVFYPDGVLGNYLESLGKLQRLVEEGKAHRFLPGHGYPIEDPLRIIKATREHREERLAQVKKALAAGTPDNPDALFDVVYQGVDPALKAPSIRSIQAQLEYLGIEAR